MAHFTPLYIDGRWTTTNVAEATRTFDVVNPASGEVVGQAASASSEECKAAVDAAATAFKSWEHSTHAERRAIFLKAAELVSVNEYKKHIVVAMQAETAAEEYWCTFNWVVAANQLRTVTGMLSELAGQTLPSGVAGARLETHRRAMGVILSIAPWNGPFTLALRAIAIPILCGNTVVLKSSEASPRSQALIVQLFHDAGLPAGVLNYVSVSREDAPVRTAELIAYPAVRKVTFTGSDRVGKIIAMEAAKHLKPCVLELGGSAPVIVHRFTVRK
ncbi:hypothetical protein H0H81_007334 [Sphagnurus paluster]|uniref:Aldehyde dehydrogenase domain-containing protein n=1 Tax=Sphagnurus paluster TaxID=117069 RepID=A0A9P7KLQ2_9AGAR|nr:hypothetical protein H0H81_007334 [Sphagnurus paluster]